MITLFVLLYVAAGVFAFPKIVRALAADLRNGDMMPLEVFEQFMCCFFGLILSAVWPLPFLFSMTRHSLFPEEGTK